MEHSGSSTFELDRRNRDEFITMKIAVTGANSSVGLNLLDHVVADQELRIIAAVRSERASAMLPVAPQIEAAIISYHDVGGLAKSIASASCVVHLAGILIEGKGSTYASSNIAATEAVVKAAQSAEVKHLVFISVVGASLTSSNAYFRSKALAEKLVAESGISATIIRTPILLGPETAGARALVEAAAQSRAKLLGGGRYFMRPLDVDDLSLAILKSCKSQVKGVAVHELVGPDSIAYRDLVSRVARMLGKEVTIGTIPIWSAKIVAAISSRLQRGGISPTVIDVITMNEVVHRNADAAIGITLTPMDKTLEKIVATQKNTI